MTLDDILAGHPAAIRALATSSVETWQLLLEHLAEHRPEEAPAAFVVALLDETASMEEWHRRAEKAASEMTSAWFSTIKSGTRPFKSFLANGVRVAMPPDHPASLAVRYQELLGSGEDGDLERARALADDVQRVRGTSKMHAEVLLLVARRADETGNLAVATSAAADAEREYDALGDVGGVQIALRARGVALLRAGQLDEAFAVLDVVLERPGPMFGGPGVHVSRGGLDDPQEAALDEAATVATWCARTTPEWVRALGALAERIGTPELARRFAASLAALAGQGSAVSDLEVVVRQASERELDETALAAANLLVDRFAGDLEAAHVAGSFFARKGELDRAWRIYARAAESNSDDADVASTWLCAAELAARVGANDDARRALANARRTIGEDPEDTLRVGLAAIKIEHEPESPAAAEALFRLFEGARADAELLAETSTGVALVEATIDALLHRRDRRALVVAEALYQAKVDLFGECPSAWLELHNRGTVHAQLGELAKARELVEQALTCLRDAVGEHHPHVQMAQRTLARLADEERRS